MVQERGDFGRLGLILTTYLIKKNKEKGNMGRKMGKKKGRGKENMRGEFRFNCLEILPYD